MLAFGGLLVLVGLIARSTAVTDDPNQAFGAVMTELLPPWAAAIAILLVLTTVMSTADTEMFLSGGLLSRELSRLQGHRSQDEIIASTSVKLARLAVSICTSVAVSLALYVRDLVALYTWLISALLILAPMVVGSLFIPRETRAGPISLVVSGLAFCALALAGKITPETAYYVLVPGFGSYFLALLLARVKETKA